MSSSLEESPKHRPLTLKVHALAALPHPPEVLLKCLKWVQVFWLSLSEEVIPLLLLFYRDNILFHALLFSHLSFLCQPTLGLKLLFQLSLFKLLPQRPLPYCAIALLLRAASSAN